VNGGQAHHDVYTVHNYIVAVPLNCTVSIGISTCSGDVKLNKGEKREKKIKATIVINQYFSHQKIKEKNSLVRFYFHFFNEL